MSSKRNDKNEPPTEIEPVPYGNWLGRHGFDSLRGLI